MTTRCQKWRRHVSKKVMAHGQKSREYLSICHEECYHLSWTLRHVTKMSQIPQCFPREMLQRQQNIKASDKYREHLNVCCRNWRRQVSKTLRHVEKTNTLSVCCKRCSHVSISRDSLCPIWYLAMASAMSTYLVTTSATSSNLATNTNNLATNHQNKSEWAQNFRLGLFGS